MTRTVDRPKLSIRRWKRWGRRSTGILGTGSWRNIPWAGNFAFGRDESPFGGGPLHGSTPTNAQYGQALQRALEAGGLSPADAADLAAQAARQRAAYGILESAPVPNIPGRLPQRRP